MCATAPTTHYNGYIVQAAVIVNQQPDTKQSDGTTRYYSSCRSGAEWTDMFAHESDTPSGCRTASRPPPQS
jgi:hypothetical protein